jgi:hypothetical protein
VWKVLAINDKKEKWLEEQAGKKCGDNSFSGFWLKTEILEEYIRVNPPLVSFNVLSVDYLFRADRIYLFPGSPPPEGLVC